MKSTIWIAVVLAGAAVVGGCKSEPKAARPTDDFLPDDANRTLWRTLEKQSAAGAAEDGMLYSYHFDGAGLSDLGRDKLDLMVRSERRPLVVFVNVAEDDQMSARKESVTRFLAGAGLSADASRVETGMNPRATSPVAPNLARMEKTESPGPVASDYGDGTTSTGVDTTTQN